MANARNKREGTLLQTNMAEVFMTIELHLQCRLINDF